MNTIESRLTSLLQHGAAGVAFGGGGSPHSANGMDVLRQSLNSSGGDVHVHRSSSPMTMNTVPIAEKVKKKDAAAVPPPSRRRDDHNGDTNATGKDPIEKRYRTLKRQYATMDADLRTQKMKNTERGDEVKKLKRQLAKQTQETQVMQSELNRLKSDLTMKEQQLIQFAKKAKQDREDAVSDAIAEFKLSLVQNRGEKGVDAEKNDNNNNNDN